MRAKVCIGCNLPARHTKDKSHNTLSERSPAGYDALSTTEFQQEVPVSESTSSQSIGSLIQRGLRLRCPACGQGKIFRSWLAMNDPCPSCGRKFDREPGYLLGSIYINYGMTAVLVVVMYFALYFSGTMTNQQRLLALIGFSLLFPLWFFRYARSLWIAFDEQFDPWPNEKERREADRD
jgi:uncharacterized protein (DUF983 family)